MADKKYNLSFELTDGTIQNVQFTAPQGERGVGIETLSPVGETGKPGATDTYVIGYTDKSATTFRVYNGKDGKDGDDGYTPVSGKDYWTDADKAEIVSEVIKYFGGMPIVGTVDENNNIVLTGNLTEGTYFVKYEMEDGSTLNIGTLVFDNNVYYSVTKNLTNCTIGNSATSVIEGESYSATITANDGYEISSVVVTMGGANVSVTNGEIDIASVTGNIVITAVATEKIVTSNYSVTNKLYGCTTNNSAETVTGGNGYSATISAESGYAGHTAVYVTMGGVNVSSTAVNGDKIDIANVTGDIVISCVGYESNKRINSSGEKAETGYELTAFIPATWNDTLYMSGVTSNTTASMAGFYSAAVTGTSARITATHTHYVFNNADTFINGETVSRKLSTSNLQILIENRDSVAFVRFSAHDINENSIITVNHPIV